MSSALVCFAKRHAAHLGRWRGLRAQAPLAVAHPAVSQRRDCRLTPYAMRILTALMQLSPAIEA